MYKINVYHNIRWPKYKGVVFQSLYSTSKSNGIDVNIFHIANTELDRIGLADVDLTYHRYPHQVIFDEPYQNIPRFSLYSRLVKSILGGKRDLVVLPGYHKLEYWLMLMACMIRGVRRGVFCDSGLADRPRSTVKNILKRLFFSKCQVFFVYGQRSKEYLITLGVPSEKIFAGCQSAALPHDYEADNVLDLRNELASKSVLRYLYVGRLSPEKNLDDLLHAFKLVSATYPTGELVIVGSGPLNSKLVELAGELGLVESVIFAGPKNIDELQIEYLKASCLLLPSSSEPWGLVVNEALSFGCPVVVSHRCGCVPELVVEGKTGFVFECGNIAELAARMVDAASVFADKDRTAKECVNWIAKFSPAAASQQMLNGFKAVLGRRNGS